MVRMQKFDMSQYKDTALDLNSESIRFESRLERQPTKFSIGFSQSLPANPGIVSRIGYDHFSLNFFPIILLFTILTT